MNYSLATLCLGVRLLEVFSDFEKYHSSKILKFSMDAILKEK